MLFSIQSNVYFFRRGMLQNNYFAILLESFCKNT